MEGEINSEDLLAIGESAVVTAQIVARSVVVSGEVKGDIVAAERIELRASARVRGNITSPKLVLQDGARFEGHCETQDGNHQEGNHDDRKVAATPETRPAATANKPKKWFGLRKRA